MGMNTALMLSFWLTVVAALTTDPLYACGDAFYQKSKYTCYDGDFLCPVLNGVATLRCGPDCYLPSMYACENDHLIYLPVSAATVTSTTSSSAPSSTSSEFCQQAPTTQYLTDGPYSNYFYSDCHSASTVVITSPLADSNLTIIGPRLLVAWPAGNSGTAVFFAPANGINGTLGISLLNGTSTFPLTAVQQGNASGISTLLQLNSSAILTVSILGSVRTIRDFVEGPSILVPEIQSAVRIQDIASGVQLSRTWLDNVTTTTLSFQTVDGSLPKVENGTVAFDAGIYNFTAIFDYPQLTQLSAQKVLNNRSQDLIIQDPDRTTSLSFLSYSTKLLAGTWRFLTYFGRDSMISLLLLQDVLSEGQDGAIEAVIGAVLERVNRTDGSACHEETIGDYATYLNQQNNITSTAPMYDYKMIDTDFYLPVVMDNYLVKNSIGQSRREAFLSTSATVNPNNSGLTYHELAQFTAEKIMNITSAFARPGGQIKDNLVHLKDGQIVGEWRDSTYGIGGGRIPYDVNTALVPAALRAIGSLSAAGLFSDHQDWPKTAIEHAQVWEDSTLGFFVVSVPAAEARLLVDNYTTAAGFGFPSNSNLIVDDVQYHGLSLDGNNDQPLIKVMNTDDCFRHFLLNTTNQTQLSSFVNQTASNILNPYPVGLSNPIGLLVANPAYGGDPIYTANFSNNAYHGTVCWGWQMSMMAAGLQRQLGRCSSDAVPDFCNDAVVRSNAIAAYNHLWDLIEANTAQLSSEVWSWSYEDGFNVEELGALPPPAGVNPTESDIRQLWSLTFLAVRRDQEIR